LYVQLVQRSDGGPLLVWLDNWVGIGRPPPTTLHAQPLADDGSAGGAEAGYGGADSVGSFPGGAFVGDGFEVAFAKYSEATGYFIQFMHIDLDGTKRNDALAGPAAFGFGFSIAWTGSEFRLAYSSYCQPNPFWMCQPTQYLQRFSGEGAPVASPVELLNQGEVVLGIGGDSIIWSYPGSLARVDSMGNELWSGEPVLKSESSNARQVVKQGNDAVIAWMASGRNYTQPRFELARVRLGL
jgi:hypothetical protein